MPKAPRKPRENVVRAVAAYHERKERDPNGHISQRALAAEFDCSEGTLSAHLTGRSGASSAAFERLQKLSQGEEKALASFVRCQSRSGRPLKREDIVTMANDILINRLSSQGVARHDIEPVGVNWVDRFIKRHPQASSKWSINIDRARVTNTTRSKFELYFAQMKDLMDAHNYKPENIWNMDETGWGVGAGKKEKVIVWVDREGEGNDEEEGRPVEPGVRAATKPQGQEWVTSIEAISAAGELAKPVLIVKSTNKAERFDPAWRPAEGTDGWVFAVSHKGWTSYKIAMTWLEHFNTLSAPIEPTDRRLLILDGHGSHFQYQFGVKAIGYGIDILALPPHTSHRSQPLDVGVFGPFKTKLYRMTSTAQRIATTSMPKPEWIALFAKARDCSITSANIRKGFEATGIYPYNPSRLLDRLPSSPPPRRRQPLPVTPRASLTSEADEFLEEQGDEMSPVIKSKFRQLAVLAENERAQNVVLGTQVRELTKRDKKPRAGISTDWLKTHHMTDPETLEAIRQREEVTKVNTARRQKRKVEIAVKDLQARLSGPWAHEGGGSSTNRQDLA